MFIALATIISQESRGVCSSVYLNIRLLLFFSVALFGRSAYLTPKSHHHCRYHRSFYLVAGFWSGPVASLGYHVHVLGARPHHWALRGCGRYSLCHPVASLPPTVHFRPRHPGAHTAGTEVSKPQSWERKRVLRCIMFLGKVGADSWLPFNVTGH